jgi:4'-phosphopantetheinyl transferase
MPLIKIQPTGNQGAWALWFISEQEEELIDLLQERPESSIIHSTKRLEWLAGRLLLQQLTEHFGLDYHGTTKDEFGKPYLKDLPHHISLSHSFPYVAGQINLHHEIGIDLEQPKPKLLTVAHRILAPSELNDAGTDVIKHCVYWCAKETMYKVYGKKGIFFLDQLQVEPFTLKNMGDIYGKINTPDYSQRLPMTYLVQPDYVLVHTKTQSL